MNYFKGFYDQDIAYSPNWYGEVFGKLTPLEMSHTRDKDNRIMLVCRCECGNTTTVRLKDLKRGHTKSCGHCTDNRFYEQDGHMVGVTTKGQEFLFDKEDFATIKPHTWHIDNRGYVATRIKNKTVLLHRFIMNPLNGEEVDHKCHDTLDCRKVSLRIVTSQQNKWNTRKGSMNKSGYKGVSWSKHAKKWVVRIHLNNKAIHIGYFNNLEDAANAYNQKAMDLFGEYACLNDL